jgi:AraC family transcriptional regulator, transcriptional activator of the genes for pyochelin and ferripyochelin receptors
MDFRMDTYEFGIGMPDDLGEGLIHHCHGLADKTENLTIDLERHFLGFVFNLGRTIHFNAGNFMSTIPRRHYLLAYIPKGNYHLTVESGKHALFCIEFTFPWLDRLRTLFPALTEFFQMITDENVYFSKPYHTTSRSMTEIEYSLHNEFTGPARDLLIGTKYILISMDCLRQMQTHDVEEIEKIRDAYEYMQKNLQFPCNVSSLADRLGMPTKKLEKAFKKLYGVTVYRALTNERLNRSVYYLRDSNLPITKIAALVGYRNSDVFYSTFKRNFGYPPGELRKKPGK